MGFLLPIYLVLLAYLAFLVSFEVSLLRVLLVADLVYLVAILLVSELHDLVFILVILYLAVDLAFNVVYLLLLL